MKKITITLLLIIIISPSFGQKKVSYIDKQVIKYVSTHNPRYENFGQKKAKYKGYRLKTYMMTVNELGKATPSDLKIWKDRNKNKYTFYFEMYTSNGRSINNFTFLPNSELRSQKLQIDRKISEQIAEKEKQREEKRIRDSISRAPYDQIYKNTCSKKIEYHKKQNPNYIVKEYKDGTYIGEFKNDMREGKGVFIYKIIRYEKRCKIYDGAWKNDKKEGFGIYEYEGFRGNIYKYVGQFSNDKQHGQGTFYENNKVDFCGRYAYGKPVHNNSSNNQTSQNSSKCNFEFVLSEDVYKVGSNKVPVYHVMLNGERICRAYYYKGDALTSKGWYEIALTKSKLGDTKEDAIEHLKIFWCKN